VRAQHRLLTEQFGIERRELVLGWSMGAEQTYEWAVRFPDMVKRALPYVGLEAFGAPRLDLHAGDRLLSAVDEEFLRAAGRVDEQPATGSCACSPHRMRRCRPCSTSHYTVARD
jgi:homoserine O-acetyltransferase